jgi:hypothetical protein
MMYAVAVVIAVLVGGIGAAFSYLKPAGGFGGGNAVAPVSAATQAVSSSGISSVSVNARDVIEREPAFEITTGIATIYPPPGGAPRELIFGKFPVGYHALFGGGVKVADGKDAK